MTYSVLDDQKKLNKTFLHSKLKKIKNLSRTCTEVEGLYKEKWNSRIFQGLSLKFNDLCLLERMLCYAFSARFDMLSLL